MYSILLVEDEKLELETLRDYVDWKKLGIGPVYTARNGKRAMECMEKYAPDIVITDVQMPVMNGIQFARQLIEEGYTSKIIFLTGYDDFEYIKAAFEVHAVDYLLKPFMVEDVEVCIEKVKKQLEKEKINSWSKKYAFGQALQAFLSGEITADTMRQYYGALMERDASQIRIGIGAVYSRCSDDQINALRQRFSEIFYLYRWREILVFLLREYAAPKDASTRILNFLQEKFRKKSTLVYFEKQSEIEQLKERTNLLYGLRDFVFYQKTGISLAVEKLTIDLKEIENKTDRHIQPVKIRELCSALGMGEHERAHEICRMCFEEVYGSSRSAAVREIYAVYLYLKEYLVEADSSLKLWMKEYHSVREEDILYVENCEELENWMESYIDKILSYFSKQKENPNYYAVVQTKTYLREHYAENIDVEKLSRVVGLSPNYLRSLFKEMTGKTILEYSVELRMEKAAELLKNKSLRVKEVSAAVGYGNVSYFGTLFQKKYGVTPNEYRKMV